MLHYSVDMRVIPAFFPVKSQLLNMFVKNWIVQIVSQTGPHKRALCFCVNSRSQMRDSSSFAGVVTVCSLCVCRAVPTSQMPSCTPWDRTALDSGTLMGMFSRYLTPNWLHGLINVLLFFQNIRSGSLLSAYRCGLHYISKGECVLHPLVSSWDKDPDFICLY